MSNKSQKFVVFEAEKIEVLKTRSLASAAGYLCTHGLRYNGSPWRYRDTRTGELYDLRRLPDGRLLLRKLTPVGEFDSPTRANAFVSSAREHAQDGAEYFWAQVQ